MKKIVHLIVGLETGGTETMLLRTLPYLEGDSHIVCSITTLGPIGEQLSKAGVQVFALNAKKGFSFAAFMSILHFVQREKPDILQTYLSHADILGRFAAAFARVPVTIGSIRAKLRELRFVPLIILDVVTSFLVDAYIANSETSKQWLQRWGVRKEKITVIYNGIDMAKFTRISDRDAVRQSFSANHSTNVIGCVAKFRTQKGHKYLLEAFSVFLKQFPDSKLILTGDGPIRKSMQRLASKLTIQDSVIFLGDRKDVAYLLNAMDIFVMPTLYEGMSNSIMEAMAAGLPIVTTDIRENRELIINGEHGILVKPKDVTGIVQAMNIMVQQKDLAKELGAKARMRIQNDFTIDKTIQKLTEYYVSLSSMLAS